MPPFSEHELNYYLNESLRRGDFAHLNNNPTAQRVFNAATRALEKSGYDEEPSAYDNKYEILEAVQENFDRIISQLNKLRAAKRKVVTKFPKWKPIREQTIRELIKIALNINMHRKNCNISKLFCTVVSAVGCGVTVTSAILLPFTFGLSAPLGIAGFAMAGTGGAGAFGTSMTELGLEVSNMKAAKATQKKDEESFSFMEEWVKCSASLQEAIDKVIGFSALKEILLSLKQLGDDFSKISDNDIFIFVTNALNLFKEALPHLLQLAPFILTYIVIIVSSVHNRYLFDSFVFLNRSLSGIVVLIDVLKNGSLLGLKGVQQINTVVAKAVARGALSGFALALDITSIVVTSIDVHKGSKSKNAEALLKCAEELQKQLDFLELMYEELKKSEVKLKTKIKNTGAITFKA